MSVIEKIIKFVDEKLKSYDVRRKPLFILISGPQGSGKSYNSKKLCNYLNFKYRTIYLSLDDFYLTYEAQLALQTKFPENKLLHGRGLPGTHDLSLLKQVLLNLTKNNGILELPQYDKSMFGGKGDRCSKFLKKYLPVDLVILEGWLIGFDALTETQLMKKIDGQSKTLSQNPLAYLEQINKNLKNYEFIWNNKDFESIGIILECDNKENVYEWRLEQEHDLILQKGIGMNDEEVYKFVDRYYPCYELYYDNLIKASILGSLATLTLKINFKREIIEDLEINS